ncbi:uncharacterized protein Z518_03620 [Rhinocladiella mackenziei CBS 650.93]|uniref:Transcription factor domain-containing protein n=1 Tax=Rhinocladiella mackenziei CBS 650.93 TaxID=1442369 RepID=A0A0D2H5F7_9EURO|nr:uncharacterized protein Z518_03620 [Rhinocladiella mackenziei CBS 650.93]KIX05648.1 hypothetical protein Z518_03620 [Rhinocladiella mackenziei CBS 650.93]
MVSRTELVPSLVRGASNRPEAAADDIPNSLSDIPVENRRPAQMGLIARLEHNPEEVDSYAMDWVNFSWDSSLQQGSLTNSASTSLSTRQPIFLQNDFPGIPTTSSRSRPLIRRRPGTAAAEQGARLVLHIIRAFPEMMQRRQTFPPFIHQHWHTPTLPEKLATCMSISQLFVSRTHETKPFLWRSIDHEEQRFRDELENYSKHETLAAMQALVIYTIIAIVDQDGEIPPRYGRLTRTFKMMTIRFIRLLGAAPFSEAEWANPSLQWEDWVFAESRRRLGCLWFIISRIVCPDADLLCPTLKACRNKPLCTAKAMWEARSREEWETARAFFDAGLLYTDVWNFGALIDAHYNRDPLNTMRLDAWEAGTDKMGVLLSIAISLFDNDMEESQTDLSPAGCSR